MDKGLWQSAALSLGFALLPNRARAENFPNPGYQSDVGSNGFTSPYTKTVITANQAYNTDQNTMDFTFFAEQNS